MSLTIGSRLGPYEIVAKLGEGGMGEVFQATDTNLKRSVALKVLPQALASDAERLQRFQREAEILAVLNHPNIAAIYGLERSSGATALVMELVEGPTLADRLARGPVPPSEAIAIATQIAEALEAAHEAGIVHRDLKPANIKVRLDDTVKVLDFGLAKNAGEAAEKTGSTESTTMSPAMTQAGMILGTAAYMAPEQAKGRRVDRRADVWAFGAVLYEMVTGTRAFAGDDVSEVLASVLAREPDWSRVRADTPVIASVIRRCLQRDPKQRFGDMQSVRLALGGAFNGVMPASPVDTPATRNRERILISVAALAVIAAGTMAYAWYPRAIPPPAAIAFQIDAPPRQNLAAGPGLASLSPDGSRVAFVVGTGTTTGGPDANYLWVRDLASLTSYQVSPEPGVWQPAWSPNGQSVVVTRAGGATALRRIDLATRTESVFGPPASGRPAWSKSGVIVFQSERQLWRIPENGGTATLVMALDPERQEVELAWPYFLPDGRRYVFLARSSDDSKSALFLAALDSTERTLLVNATSSVEYAAGYLFYHRKGVLMAHPFDAQAGRLTGEPVPVLQNVRYNRLTGRAAFSVSESGTLVYSTGDEITFGDTRRVMMFDRTGQSPKPIGPVGAYSAAVLSPDGQRAIVTMGAAPGVARGESTRPFLSFLDLERGVLTRFTMGDVEEKDPLWSPDGSSIVFTSVRNGKTGLYRRSAAGGATSDEELFTSTDDLDATGVSPNNDVLLFRRGSPGSSRIWALPLTGERKPFEVIRGLPVPQYQAKFSPDGKWIVFGAGEGAGKGEIYIQPFPADDRRVQISTDTGRYPHWTKDGTEIIYRTGSDDFMLVTLTPFGNSYKPSAPTKLFNSPKALPGTYTFGLDEHGKRFLMVVPPDKAQPIVAAPLTVIVNWVQNLKKQ